MTDENEKQDREVAEKFARDAIRLIQRGKARDVCARKLQAAATVMFNKPVDLAHELRELERLRADLEITKAELEDIKSERDALADELTDINAHDTEVSP